MEHSPERGGLHGRMSNETFQGLSQHGKDLVDPLGPPEELQPELPLEFSERPYSMVVSFGDRKFKFGPYGSIEHFQWVADRLAEMMGEMNLVQNLNKVSGNWHGTIREDPYDPDCKRWLVWSCYASQKD